MKYKRLPGIMKSHFPLYNFAQSNRDAKQSADVCSVGHPSINIKISLNIMFYKM